MEQENLFFDGTADALRHVVRVLGGAKKVGHLLRRGKSPDDAGRWLANALDGDRRETLHLDDLIHLLQLARTANCHAAMVELSRETGYESRPIEPEDEAQSLMRDYIAAAKSMETIAKKLERLALPLRVMGA